MSAEEVNALYHLQPTNYVGAKFITNNVMRRNLMFPVSNPPFPEEIFNNYVGCIDYYYHFGGSPVTITFGYDDRCIYIKFESAKGNTKLLIINNEDFGLFGMYVPPEIMKNIDIFEKISSAVDAMVKDADVPKDDTPIQFPEWCNDFCLHCFVRKLTSQGTYGLTSPQSPPLPNFIEICWTDMKKNLNLITP